MKSVKDRFKLWSESQMHDTTVEAFTVGTDRETDLLLAPFDILGSLAHGRMLESIHILSSEEWQKLRDELQILYRRAAEGTFKIEEHVEDVHSQVELMLTDRLGDTGRKIHTGRSRNDQVLLDIRLFTRDRIRILVQEIKTLFDTLIRLSDAFRDHLMPGYTHLQVAMPSSFGLWLASFAESLVDDLLQLHGAFRIVNRNPLGSAAGYGSSFPLNRAMTTELLGFDAMNYNSIYAQAGRGRTERIVSQALVSLAETMGRLAMDCVLFMSQNFGFISFPESVTTGSSIMPHKKNPDLFEVIRAKCNSLRTLPNHIMMIYANLPTGYHRDFQEIKQPYLSAFLEIESCIRMLNRVLPEMRIQENLLNNQIYNHIFSVELVNEKVRNGISFRDAYHQVAEELACKEHKRPDEVRYTHEGSIGNLCNDQIRQSMDAVMASFRFSKIDRAYAALLSRKS